MERNLPSSSNISVIKEMRRPERVHLICQSRTFWKYTTTTFILLFSNNALWEIFRSEITIAEYFIGRSEVVESYQVTEQNLTVFIKSLLRNDPAFFYSDPVHCLSEFWATAQDSFPAKIRGTTDEGQVGWQSIDEEDLILIIFSSDLANSPNIENYEQPELHYFSQYVRIYVSYQVIYGQLWHILFRSRTTATCCFLTPGRTLITAQTRRKMWGDSRSWTTFSHRAGIRVGHSRSDIKMSVLGGIST